LLNGWLMLATLRDSEVESRHDSSWDPNMALRAPRYVISVTLASYTFVSHFGCKVLQPSTDKWWTLMNGRNKFMFPECSIKLYSFP